MQAPDRASEVVADDPFDPARPFVAEDGIEYDSLAHYICGRPVVCRRNDVIRVLAFHPLAKDPQDNGRWIAAQYYHQSRDGVGGTGHPFPQFWNRHAPNFLTEGIVGATTRAAGTGQPNPEPAQAAAVREASECEVQRRVGA